MDIRDLITNILDKKGEVKASDIVEVTGFSRAYINRFFQSLREEGKIVLIGKANKARYISAAKGAVASARDGVSRVHRILNNKGLAENVVLDEIKKESGIFKDIPENISRILDYAFTEMLNNAIEHSKSEKIEISIEKDKKGIRFDITDKGIGIFSSIKEKKNLRDEMEAAQDLLKGKLTTEPEAHSGEGIFFTSKAGDIFTVQSKPKKLIFDNITEDIFIKNAAKSPGTRVTFSINAGSDRNLENIFKKYTDDSYAFSKTDVTVKLYKTDTKYISRSQARRIISGLDKFKTITLDFSDVKMVGQGFADEIFRIWKSRRPDMDIIVQNADENVQFMIDRAIASKPGTDL